MPPTPALTGAETAVSLEREFVRLIRTNYQAGWLGRESCPTGSCGSRTFRHGDGTKSDTVSVVDARRALQTGLEVLKPLAGWNDLVGGPATCGIAGARLGILRVPVVRPRFGEDTAPGHFWPGRRVRTELRMATGVGRGAVMVDAFGRACRRTS